MKNVRELREQLSELIDENSALVELAEGEERDLTEDESTEFDSRTEKIEALNVKIERQEKIEEQRKTAAKVAGNQASKSEEREIDKQFTFGGYVQDIYRNGEPTGFNKEMHEEAANEARANGGLAGHGIPEKALRSNVIKRAHSAGTTTEGGFTVQTDVSTNFIESLENAMVTRRAGAQFITGLQGDVDIPKFGSMSFAWEGEIDANAEASSTLSRVQLSPTRLGGYADISKQLMQQSELVFDGIISRMLVEGVAREFDIAGLTGSGASNQPTGVIATVGVNTVSHGTNGGAPTWAKVVEFESNVNQDNAPMGRNGYITTSKVNGKLKTVAKDAGSGLFLAEFGQTNGSPIYVTNGLSDVKTKGTGAALSDMVYSSDWSELILAMWGGIDLLVDPYTQGTTAQLRLIVNMFGDVGVRNAVSFAIAEDIDAS